MDTARKQEFERLEALERAGEGWFERDGKLYRRRPKPEPQGLAMRTFYVPVITNPSRFEEAIGITAERKTVTIKGYTLKDAKRRARIE